MCGSVGVTEKPARISSGLFFYIKTRSESKCGGQIDTVEVVGGGGDFAATDEIVRILSLMGLLVAHIFKANLESQGMLS